MNKNEFIVGDEYIYNGNSDPMTYAGEGYIQGVGVFKSDSSNVFHCKYTRMTSCTKPYPNPPLPHCKERIAFAKGANIEYSRSEGNWYPTHNPTWNPNFKYRVKVEKTKDDLRIEELEENIRALEDCVKAYKKELAVILTRGMYL
jgi:hypothetical protein